MKKIKYYLKITIKKLYQFKLLIYFKFIFIYVNIFIFIYVNIFIFIFNWIIYRN